MNTQLSWTEEHDSFRQFLLVSLILHAALLLSAGVKSVLFPSQMIELPPSIRVDIVALPDKQLQTMPAPMKTPEPAKAIPAPKPEVKPAAKPAAKTPATDLASQKKAIEKLKAMTALEKIQKDVAKEQTKEAASTPPPAAAQVVKGNIISSGSNFQGLARLRVNDYLSDIKARVGENWILPQWLSESTLKAAVLMQIDSRGTIVRNEIYTTSGNSVFDSSCLAAVQNASPFPPAPREVSDNLILIRFPFD